MFYDNFKKRQGRTFQANCKYCRYLSYSKYLNSSLSRSASWSTLSGSTLGKNKLTNVNNHKLSSSFTVLDLFVTHLSSRCSDNTRITCGTNATLGDRSKIEIIRMGKSTSVGDRTSSGFDKSSLKHSTSFRITR